MVILLYAEIHVLGYRESFKNFLNMAEKINEYDIPKLIDYPRVKNPSSSVNGGEITISTSKKPRILRGFVMNSFVMKDLFLFPPLVEMRRSSALLIRFRHSC